MNTLWPWIIFIVFVLALLALDLGVFHRHPHPVRWREAAAWSAFWVALSLAFNLGIYWRYGAEAALQFFTSYLLENSLSTDNLFLFAVIFASLGVATEYQHRVLFGGVMGALVLRGAFIAAGVQLVRHFHGILYLFAIFLIFMGLRFLGVQGREYDPNRSRVVRLARKLFPISDQYEGGHFFTRCDGRLCATPLLLVLIMIEVVDLTFALDSIPAIFAITQDAFIIFTSNVLAILGLRSLYFLLVRAMSRFQYLHTAMAVLLIFIGARMLLAPWVSISTGIALLGISLILGTAILASLLTVAKKCSAPTPRRLAP
jgi:tellurite resistance protein TerC